MHFRPPFRGCFRICGHDKSAPTAACGLPFRCERFVNNATLTHEIGCEHSARRRGPIHRARILTLSNIHIRITKYVHSHHRTHISTLSNTCFRFNAHAFPHYQIRAFTPPHAHFRLSFCGCIRICGHDKSDPYGC